MVCVVQERQGDMHGVQIGYPEDAVEGYVRLGQIWRHWKR